MEQLRCGKTSDQNVQHVLQKLRFAFYQPHSNLLQVAKSCCRKYGVVLLFATYCMNKKPVFAKHAATFTCFKTGLKGGVKKRNIAFQHVLRQCCKKRFHVFVARFTVALKVCSRSLCQMTEMHECMKAVMTKHWSVVYTFMILHWPKINQGQVLCNLFERSVGRVPLDSCSYVFR